MATHRYVQTCFWLDNEVQDYSSEEKYFYLYLLTNPYTAQCGIYKLPLRNVAAEMAIEYEAVKKLIEKFEGYEKIRYSKKTGEIAIKNWAKYNKSTSPKVTACIEKELSEINDKNLIPYVYSNNTIPEENENDTDTLSIPYPYPTDTLSIEDGYDGGKKIKDNKITNNSLRESNTSPKVDLPTPQPQNSLTNSDTEPEEALPFTDLEERGTKKASFTPPQPVDNLLFPVDNCPHKEIINLYHSMLPTLPRVRDWTEHRQKLLRTRWREKPERQTLTWWEEFFKAVSRSKFLLGSTGKFQADLEWLLHPEKFLRVLEGRYADREQQNVFQQAAKKDPDEILNKFHNLFAPDNGKTINADYTVKEVV